jgi:oligopeptide/dipeptide ABC transporter ATP-binding protein
VTLLSVDGLKVHFRTGGGLLRAVDGVSFDVAAGETVGLVGESGCGKSTLARAIIRLVPITAGHVLLDGQDLAAASPRELRQMRPLVQMVFQDPYGSLNPRRVIGSIVAQPMLLAGWSRRDARERVAALLRQVGLSAAAAGRYPHEFSGGQRQRIGIARALALNPRLIICDEPVSALDVSVRAQVMNLLNAIQAETGVAYLFISHDLSVVEHISDRILVMYLGRIVELGTRQSIWARPLHPYTQGLLASAPIPNPKLARARPRIAVQGELPSPLAPPGGCAFHTRCPIAVARCRSETPALRRIDDAAMVACHLVTGLRSQEHAYGAVAQSG